MAGLLTAGVAVRCWIAFTNYGVGYDTETFSIVSSLLHTHPLHAYSSLRYPYPGGYLPVLWVCGRIAAALGVPFWAVVKVPAILADAGISVALVWGLGRLGGGPRARVGAVALVAFGPIFLVVSGFHGQVDPAAILPALIAVVLWRGGGDGRAWPAGVLVGLAAAAKTVPFFMVLAMLPTVRDRREALRLLVPAVAIPLVSVLPFLIGDTHATFKSLTENQGVPGIGGLSVLVQPGLLHGWLHGRLPPVSGATLFFLHRQNLIVGLAVLLAGGFAWRSRMEVVSAAVLIWLAVYVANFNWAFQYWIWGMPFFLLAGRLREVAVLQALLVLPAAELYFHFQVPRLGWTVLPLTLITWAALALIAAVVLRRRSAVAAALSVG